MNPPPPVTASVPALAQGWNTWNTRSVLSHVHLPSGLALNLAFCHYGLLAAEEPARARNAARETLRERVDGEFVPNVVNGSGRRSADRSQPCVGGIAVLALHELAPERAFLEEVWPALLAWNRWWHRARRNRAGLLSWGSCPVPPVVGDRAEFLQPNTARGAALESGMDNSPVFDGVPFEVMIRRHLMNKQEFWGEWVLPAVPRSDPAFAEQHYFYFVMYECGRGALTPRNSDSESVSRGEGTPPTNTEAFTEKFRRRNKVALLARSGVGAAQLPRLSRTAASGAPTGCPACRWAPTRCGRFTLISTN